MSPNTPAPSTRRTAARVSLPWTLAFAALVCFIWGNSMVPGEDSGAFSMMVTEQIRGLLAGAGLPYEWVTNFLVRKTAHFSEYCALALVGMQAFGPHREPVRTMPVVLTTLGLVAVPCVDETIQLFTADRAGQPTDVLIDCCGALTGCLLTLLVARLRTRSRRSS